MKHKSYPGIRFLFVTFISLVNILLYDRIQAQPVITNDDFPPFFEIEARVRNGNTGFEGALFSPSTPPPGQPGGGQWQMNPAGAPVWNSNGNTYGNIHSFLFTYIQATGNSVWRIDFNRDGDYDDAQETVPNDAPTLVGKGFRYINLYLQGHSSGLSANVTNFTINNVDFGSFTSNSETPTSILFEDVNGLFTDTITISGHFSFSGDGGQERPRIWVKLGTANISPECSITDPPIGTFYNVGDAVTINATASDPGGIVSLVEFYANNTLIGVDSFYPYSFTWIAPASGLVPLKVKAIDSYDATTLSAPVNIVINTPPTCIITFPTNGAVLFDPSVIDIQVSALGPEDTVIAVQFFLNGLSIGIDSFPPFHNNTIVDLPMGMYTITAKSTDNHGAFTLSSPSAITVRCVREDLDNNGTVNSTDFLLFLGVYGTSCNGCPADFNNDGGVNSFDFLRLLALLGYTCN